MVSSFYLSHWRVSFCSPLVCGRLLIGTVSKHVTLFVPLLLSASNLSGRPAGRLTNTMPALLCTIVGQLCKWAGHFTMNTSLDLPATNPSSWLATISWCGVTASHANWMFWVKRCDIWAHSTLERQPGVTFSGTFLKIRKPARATPNSPKIVPDTCYSDHRGALPWHVSRMLQPGFASCFDHSAPSSKCGIWGITKLFLNWHKTQVGGLFLGRLAGWMSSDPTLEVGNLHSRIDVPLDMNWPKYACITVGLWSVQFISCCFQTSCEAAGGTCTLDIVCRWIYWIHPTAITLPTAAFVQSNLYTKYHILS